MITYLTHNQIDKQRWDNCIEHSFNGNVYAWSWYLDIVHPCWEALVEDDYVRVMPLTNNYKFGINYLFQPFFVQQLGVFSKEILTTDQISEFIEAIPPKFKFAEIRLNSGNIINHEIQNVDNHRNIVLSLDSDYDLLNKKYSNNTKRDIAKAKKANLVITNDVEPAQVAKLFRENRGREVKHWGNDEYKRLILLANTAIHHGKCFIRGVLSTDNQLIAGAIFMVSHDSVVFLFSGACELNKELHALSFLIDDVIKEYSGIKKAFDFEGSDNDGLARFYRGFGGKDVIYPGLHFNKMRGLPRLAMKILRNK